MFTIFYDPYFYIVLIGVGISTLANLYIHLTYNKYSQVEATSQQTAAIICRQLLDVNGLTDVRLEGIRGELTDHYHPEEKTLRLSESTRHSSSVAAIGVAAHEVGHALQDESDYTPLKVRSNLVPITNFGQMAAMPILILGVLFGQNSGQYLIAFGLLLFSLTLIFQLVTLPVEFNASKRALAILDEQQILNRQELQQAKKILIAAALTYVATATASFLNILRLFVLNKNRR